MHHRRSAFTLIELLVVIAIITILSIVVIVTLNPAELLKQGRDANRLSDLSSLNAAIALYSNDTAGSLGTTSTNYLSIVDPSATTTAGTNCYNGGAWAFPIELGGTFHCAASSTMRNVDGTGWIPLNFNSITNGSPIATLPVDPVNTTSSLFYYTYTTDGSTFKLSATPESTKYLTQTQTNPNGFISGSNIFLAGGPLGPYWVLVPGSATLGTYNFWVMKYAAVCSDGVGNYVNAPLDGTSNGYNNNSTNCTTANSHQIASLPGGAPIVDIKQLTAATYCTNIFSSLISNTQWQAVALNTENVASNWSGGAVGSGALYQGHYNNTPAGIQVATSTDSQNYYGTNGPASGGGSGGGGNNQRRTLTLSNGSVVWDMGGNLFQWTNDMIIGTNEPNAGAGTGMGYRDFNTMTSWGTLSQATVAPSNSSWVLAQGIGQIDSEGATDASTFGFLRSGWYGLFSVDSVGMLNLSWATNTVMYHIGFRCAR